MSGRPSSSSAITRRDAIKGAVAMAALGAGSLLEGRDAAAAAASPSGRTGIAKPRSSRERVAIIGAGAGGIAAAYFLDGAYDTELFEARSKIGGHCDSHVIDYRGQRLTVDLGAQFFHPDTHPIYVTLLEQLDLYDAAHPDSDDTLEAPASLCIFPTAGGAPAFSSLNPLATPSDAVNFVTYIQRARRAVLSDMPWTITVDAWIRGLPVSQSVKNDIVYPWITALIGSNRDDALRASARAAAHISAILDRAVARGSSIDRGLAAG